MSFFNELKRRNVFKVGVTYAVLGWLLIQVIDTVLPTFEAPDWVAQTLMFVILLGFPVAVALAWAFEMTPEGIRTQRVVDDPDTTATASSGSKLNALLVGGLVLALVFVVVDSYVLEESPDAETAVAETPVSGTDVFQGEITATANLEKSIAVLPFADLSPDRDQEYFSDGLSEEILNKLAQVRDLFVVARTSSFYFKDRNEDMRSIGEQLGVNYILEGSVRKAGDNLRITAQLIQADNGFHLWSDTFDRNVADIFAIQDEIAVEVTRALSITLGTDNFNLPGSTRNVAAYDTLIQALSMPILSADDALAAINLVRESLRLDPGYARAWMVLSGYYNGTRNLFTRGSVNEFPQLSAEALARASELAPDMPLLQVAYSNIAIARDGDWLEADRILTAAMEKYGNNQPQLVGLYSLFLQNTGNINDSIPFAERTRRLDPLSGAAAASLIRARLTNGEYDRARAELERYEGPVSPYERHQLGWLIAWQQGDIDEFARLVRAYFDSDDYEGNSPLSEQYMEEFIALVQANDEDNARQEIARMFASGDYSVAELGFVQGVANHYGDADWVEQIRSEATQDSNGVGVFDWAARAALSRPTAAFKARMERNGLADYWRATGNWPDKCRPLEGSDDFECF